MSKTMTAGGSLGFVDNRSLTATLSKVPAVTFVFWLIKIAATTLGETGGDAVSMSLGLGYLTSTLIFAFVFVAAVAVQEVAVVGLPHDRWGEAVTAVVILKPGCDIDEETLKAKVRTHLSPYKCPKRILFAASMPKTATGKIQKAKLRTDMAATYRSS